tara:strand:- start:1287 stop:2477 length:1191 start_codon:yes stop_codon:yes gene_type:complete
LLLLIGCSEDTPTQQENIYGCTDNNACNFNSNANIFDNSCFYAIDWEDNCGVCDLVPSNDCTQDECGVWGGDNSACNTTTSIQLVDVYGNEIGFEGDQGYHTSCSTLEDCSIRTNTPGYTPPACSSINQAFPNPFNTITNINFTLAQSLEMTLKIFDMDMNEIKIIDEGYKNPGVYLISWDGTHQDGSIVEDGYYRIILNDLDEDSECYYNIKKDSNSTYYNYGCTDELACNYDPEAIIGDNSCEWAQENFDCYGNFNGITETDESGNYNIDESDPFDWCEFEFNSSDTGFGLNPAYPNPLASQEWGPFGQSYQLCYQFSTPYDPTWSNLNNLNIDIINNEGQSIYNYNDNYANGQTAICAYIPVADIEIIENSTIYRMVMTSGDFECHGDIQFNQ